MQLRKQRRLNNGNDGVLAVMEKLSFRIAELTFIVHDKPVDAFIGNKPLWQLHRDARINYMHAKPERVIVERRVVRDVAVNQRR